MKNTGNYKLKKPEGTDTVNIEDLNYNADIIDNELVKRALKTDMPTNLNQFTNGPGFITATGAPVQSVNGKTGTLILSASDVGAETPIGSQAKVNTLAGQVGNINDANLPAELKGKPLTEQTKILFQNADNGKKNWADVIGSPLAHSDTFSQLKDKTQTVKNILVANLTNKGQTSTGTETLTALANKVGNIAKGQGNAVESQVLAGATFTNTDGVLRTGTIPSKGKWSGTFSAGQYCDSKGNYGIEMGVPKGYYDGATSSVNASDPNFKPENIISGKNIFGLVGTAQGGSAGTVIDTSHYDIKYNTALTRENDLSEHPCYIIGLCEDSNNIYVCSSQSIGERKTCYYEVRNKLTPEKQDFCTDIQNAWNGFALESPQTEGDNRNSNSSMIIQRNLLFTLDASSTSKGNYGRVTSRDVINFNRITSTQLFFVNLSSSGIFDSRIRLLHASQVINAPFIYLIAPVNSFYEYWLFTLNSNGLGIQSKALIIGRCADDSNNKCNAMAMCSSQSLYIIKGERTLQSNGYYSLMEFSLSGSTKIKEVYLTNALPPVGTTHCNRCSMALWNGYIYLAMGFSGSVGGGDGVFKFDLNGNKIWESRTGDGYSTSIKVSSQGVFVMTWKSIIKLSLDSGTLILRQNVPSKVERGVCYANFSDGNVDFDENLFWIKNDKQLQQKGFSTTASSIILK